MAAAGQTRQGGRQGSHWALKRVPHGPSAQCAQIRPDGPEDGAMGRQNRVIRQPR